MDWDPIPQATSLTSIPADSQDGSFSKNAHKDANDSDWKDEGQEAKELGDHNTVMFFGCCGFNPYSTFQERPF